MVKDSKGHSSHVRWKSQDVFSKGETSFSQELYYRFLIIFEISQCSSGQAAHTMTRGEFHSALAVREVVLDFVPKPVAWGQYEDGHTQVDFYLADFHDMDLRAAPDPRTFTAKVAQLHSNSKSPNGNFGFHVPTVLGIFERTLKWESSWAQCFTNQLCDVIKYDNKTNGAGPSSTPPVIRSSTR